MTYQFQALEIKLLYSYIYNIYIIYTFEESSMKTMIIVSYPKAWRTYFRLRTVIQIGL